MLLRSIRARMTTAFAISITLLALLSCLTIVSYSRRIDERNARILLRNTAREIAVDLTKASGDVNSPAVRETIQSELRGDNLAAAVFDNRGRLIISFQHDIPPWPPRNSHQWRVTTIRSGQGHMVIGLPWEKTARVLRSLAVKLLILGLVVVVSTTLGAWVLVGRTLSPVRQLARQAREASADRLGLILSTPSRDAEITELVSTLNGLLERVSQAAETKSRFYSSASHELRTPLQALLGHLEVALSRQRDAESYRAALEESHSQAQRIVTLVRDLLLLTQLESAPSQPQTEPVDMMDICERALAYYRPLAKERGLNLQVSPPADLEICVPPSHAEIMVRNLIENAVKYATDRGLVEVLLESRPSPRLEVSNDYPSDQRLDTETLFEPFARATRNTMSRSDGSGLGLAICKAIAAANGWEFELWQQGGKVTAKVVFVPGADD